MTMMADRYKPIFFAIISLTIVWFIIVLLYLPQNDDDLFKQQQQQQSQNSRHQWSPSPISLALTITGSASFPPAAAAGPSTRQTISPEDPALSISHYGQNDDEDQLYYPQRIPQYMKYFQSNRTRKKKHQLLSRLDIIFYQLNATTATTTTNSNESRETSSIISQEQHSRETLELKTIRNPTDRFVKSEGDRLFAFNLLVSNRLGTFRLLPDTRHAKCKRELAPPSPPSVSSQPLSPNSASTTTTTATAAAQDSGQSAPSRASIIICYYNEAPSALLRTIYSILKRTGRQYMQEIIVVDDSSEPEYDVNKVKPFIQLEPLVRLTRTKRREGLIRARLFGADLAKGQVLLFLDSHVEPNTGWIEPLMEVVRVNKSTIACPIIDMINAETLVYTSSPLVKGGMNWALNFKWDSVPAKQLRTHDDFVRPIESPTMAGGLFAIDREFFYAIGSYDPGMELWGGENIELSLRTWMCGGKIVILPCSRVGHIFRKRRPYGPEPHQPESLLLNSHRVARVWLDEYIDKFYEANPDAKYMISGDVSKRSELKHKLGCKNFTWFLENVYPDLRDKDKKPPAGKDPKAISGTKLKGQRNSRPQRQVVVTSMQPPPPPLPLQQSQLVGRENVMQSLMDSENDRVTGRNRPSPYLPNMIVQFQIQSRSSNLCIESKRMHTGGAFTRLVLSTCAKIERNAEGEILINNSTILDQIWTETELHDLRLGPNRCLDVFKNLPLLRKCHNMGSFQNWSHEPPANRTSGDTSIFNTRAGLCLGVERVQIEEPIIVTVCDKATYERHNYTTAARSHYQAWRWHQTNSTSSTRLAGFALRGVAGGIPVANSATATAAAQNYHLNRTRPSQSWTLLLVNNSISTTMQQMDHEM